MPFWYCDVSIFNSVSDLFKVYSLINEDVAAEVSLIFVFPVAGADILTLRIDSEDFNPAKKYSEQYLRWRERMGIIIPDVLVMKNNQGEYIPMGLSELRDYTRMFSVFLGREFVIC